MEAKHLVDLFLKTAHVDSLSGKEKSLAEYIKSFLKKYNYSITEDESRKFSSSDTGNLIIKVGSGGEFVLLSHMDTARSTLNLKPLILEDKIVSSGDTVLGVDNRAGVTILLFMLEKIAKEKISVKDFTIAFTTCEETTLYGSKYLGVNGKIKYGFVFDSAYRPGCFINRACGAIGFNLKISGRASHSGLAPEKGINSIEIAARALSKIKQGRIDEETTLNFGKINGGSAVNVVPEFVLLEGEIRSFNEKIVQELIEEIHEKFNKEVNASGAKLALEYDWDFKPYIIDDSSYVYKNIVNVINKVGLTPQPKSSLGGSDANSLNEKGIESINLGIGAQNPHSNDEFIFIEDLVKSSEIALELVKK